MEVQRQWLFGLDDGGNLSFAVHDEVPYRERLCEAILVRQPSTPFLG
jgi:hypothetical protein